MERVRSCALLLVCAFGNFLSIKIMGFKTGLVAFWRKYANWSSIHLFSQPMNINEMSFIWWLLAKVLEISVSTCSKY